MKTAGVVAAYIATIFAANWAVATFGVVPVWPLPLIYAPAAVYFVGLAFPFRDFIQRSRPGWQGRGLSISAMLVGAGLSALVSPHFAIASGLTFLISESCDMALYTPLQKRFATAVLFSSVVSLVVDSYFFLVLAFGSLTFLSGQILGKAESVAVVMILILVWRSRALLPRYA